jgi:hypothetical protein
MFNVHVYDLKLKRPSGVLNDPFKPAYKIGRFEVYDSTGELVLSSGKRRVKNLIAGDNPTQEFLPLLLLKNKYSNSSLRLITTLNPSPRRDLTHRVIRIA